MKPKLIVILEIALFTHLVARSKLFRRKWYVV